MKINCLDVGFFLLSLMNSYDGGKEKGLFEGYGKATFTGGHSYEVKKMQERFI